MSPEQTVNALRRELQAQVDALVGSSVTAAELRKGIESLNETKKGLAALQQELVRIAPSGDVLKMVRALSDGSAREEAAQNLKKPDRVLVQLVYSFLGADIDEHSIAERKPLERKGYKFVGAAIVKKLAFIIERVDDEATLLNPLFLRHIYWLFTQLVNAFVPVVKGALFVSAMRLFVVARVRVKALSLEPPPPKLIFLQNSALPNSPNIAA